MEYTIIEDEDILNADTMINYVFMCDKAWHADYYIVRVPTLSKREKAYIYGLFDKPEYDRIKNKCLVADDSSVVVIIDISQDRDDIITYISDVVYRELSKLGCLCDKDKNDQHVL